MIYKSLKSEKQIKYKKVAESQEIRLHSVEENDFQNENYVEEVDKWTRSVFIVFLSTLVEKLFCWSTTLSGIWLRIRGQH